MTERRSIWKNKTIPGGSYEIRPLLEPILLKGELVYNVPDLKEIRAYSEEEFSKLWDEILRFEYPQTYFVDLSKKLLELKLAMLEGVKHVG